MESEGNGITVDTKNLSEAVSTVSKISSNRILPYYELEDHGEIQKMTIPVKQYNTSDKRDTAMRRYLSDWLKRKVENIAVDTRFEILDKGTSYYADDQEFPVVGSIVITWWPKKPGDDYAEWKKRRQEARDRTKT